MTIPPQEYQNSPLKEVKNKKNRLETPPIDDVNPINLVNEELAALSSNKSKKGKI